MGHRQARVSRARQKSSSSLMTHSALPWVRWNNSAKNNKKRDNDLYLESFEQNSSSLVNISVLPWACRHSLLASKARSWLMSFWRWQAIVTWFVAGTLSNPRDKPLNRGIFPPLVIHSGCLCLPSAPSPRPAAWRERERESEREREVPPLPASLTCFIDARRRSFGQRARYLVLYKYATRKLA